VEDHVHVADRPDSTVGVLPVEGQVIRVLPLLFHVLMGLNQETTGTGSGVIDLVPCLGFGDLHQEAHHFEGGVKLATLLASAVGKVLDQVFVCRTQQVRELEVVVDQHKLGLVEMVQQIFPLLVRNLGLTFDGIKIDIVF